LHSKNILHQDIKLDNIFENDLTGEVKLGDLGFASYLDSIPEQKKCE